MSLSRSNTVEGLNDSYEFVEESFYELVEDASRLASLIENHPNLNYETEYLETVDLASPDVENLENLIDESSESARDSLKKMDAALLYFEEQVEDLSGTAKDKLRAEKMWYRDRYIELESMIMDAESTPLLDEKTGKTEYEDRPEFDLETTLESETGNLEKADSMY